MAHGRECDTRGAPGDRTTRPRHVMTATVSSGPPVASIVAGGLRRLIWDLRGGVVVEPGRRSLRLQEEVVQLLCPCPERPLDPVAGHPGLDEGVLDEHTSNRSTRSRGMKTDRSGQRCRVTSLSSMA